MRLFLNLLFLPLRVVITVCIWLCALLIWVSGKILGIAAGLLMLLGLLVLTCSVKNALIVFALAFLISPLGLPMAAVGVLSVLNRAVGLLRF